MRAPHKSEAVMQYLRRRVVVLQHGALFNNQQKHWTIRRIAIALDLPYRTVQDILKRWKLRNFSLENLKRRRTGGRRKKLSEEERKFITSQETL